MYCAAAEGRYLDWDAKKAESVVQFKSNHY